MATRAHRFCRESTCYTTVAELKVSRTVVDETPVEHASVKGLASSYVADIELDVVDLIVFSSNPHCRFLG
jgi:hypothetical protein